MAALTFFAYFFLGIGPSVAFFISFIAQKSFLTLLTFFSCFIWLVVLLVTSAIFKGFLPFQQTVASFAGVLVASVFIQEIVRYGLWLLHKKCITMLEGVASDNGHRFVLLDKLYLALAWGYGHSACHTIFFFLSFLSLTTGSGTYYIDACPQMSLFLMGALYSLAFGMILSSIMVISFEGHHSRNWVHVAAAPLVHMGASLLTLLCMQRNGCLVAMPVNLGIGFLTMLYAGQLAWRRGVADLKGNNDLLLDARQRQQVQAGEGGGGELQPMQRQDSATGSVAGGEGIRPGDGPHLRILGQRVAQEDLGRAL